MRRTLISLMCIICMSNLYAQKDAYKTRITGKSPINIGVKKVNKVFTPFEKNNNLKSAEMKCEMNITYVDFPAEAINAFEFAISIWEQSIESKMPINIRATWEKYDGTALASCAPACFIKDFDEAPVQDVYYPIALVEKLTGEEYNGEKDADIACSFNAKSNWYFGTDGNTPGDKFDFVSAVLHEIGHGLGFSGFAEKEGENATFNNEKNLPSAYDYYIYNQFKQRISDNTIFKNPSKELLSQLISNKLVICCSKNPGNCTDAEIYAPSNWRQGVSIYHLKNSGNGPNELMAAYTYEGEAKHNPGANTLKVLSAIGWEDTNLKFRELPNTELIADVLPVQTKVISDFEFDNSSVQMFFSRDYFKTQDSVALNFDPSTSSFKGDLPTKSTAGNIQYYFKAKTKDNRVITHPKTAPKKMFGFRIGTDYNAPELVHNPINLISSRKPMANFMATAIDNIGVANVLVEYKINGIDQEPFELVSDKNTDHLFSGKLNFAAQLNKDDKIEYRISAQDCSERGNKKFLPENGYYQVNVFANQNARNSFETNFDNFESDFTSSDFSVSTPSGFSSRLLHSQDPYKTSELENEKCDLIAQLNYPIIVEENGLMTFDEVVLVEPGEEGTNYTDKLFWDYVIVEASKNNGETWNALVDGYDSRVNENWCSQFNSNLKSSVSIAAGHENMFWQQTINLTENSYFSSGDTILIRFRLASDKTVNGWGWAIDNLKIQKSFETVNEKLTFESINIYPNPVSDKMFVECPNTNDQNSVEIIITDLTGKTIFQETRYDLAYYPKQQVDLSSFKSGIYMANITDSQQNTLTQKIIKL